MFRRINIAVLACLVLYSTCNFTDVDWTDILPDLAYLCPGVEFCGKINISNNSMTQDKNQCCMDCSCNANCFETRSCCFETMKESPLREPACLHPSNVELNIPFVHYKFEMNPPRNGCIYYNPTEIIGSCSPDLKVAHWGNFFPVYSKSLKKNYKNRACAICHGANIYDDDIKEWISVVYYDDEVDIVPSMNNFYDDGFKSNHAFLVFDPPTSDSKTIEQTCYYPIEHCLVSLISIFKISSVMQLSRGTIVRACEHGPRSIYIDRVALAYKNIFCAICNSRSFRFEDKSKCSNFQSDQKVMDLPLRTLIDARYIDTFGTSKKEAIECFRKGTNLNISVCTELYCPDFKVRFPNGECDYPASYVAMNCFKLEVNLSNVQSDNLSSLDNLTDTRLLSLLEENNPWSDSWLIGRILLLNSNNRTEFEIELFSRQINFRAVNDEVLFGISKQWSINLNGKVTFVQEFAKHGRKRDAGTGKVSPLHQYTPEWSELIRNATNNVEVPVWEFKYMYVAPKRRDRCGFAIYITKLFICEQMELQPNEYQHDSKSPIQQILDLNEGEGILYPNEYMMTTDDRGSTKIRVCLGDSGYMRVGVESSVYLLHCEVCLIYYLLVVVSECSAFFNN